MRHLVASLMLIVAVAPCSSVLAQDTDLIPAPGVGELTSTDGEFDSTLDAGVGFGQIAEDYFIETALGFSFSISKLKMGILIPLRFRVIDNDPQDDGAIRSQDWDELSDYMRVLNFVQWGERRDPLYIRAGELVGTMLGHGTIVNGYNNVVDVNHFKWGLTGAVNLAFGGVEVLIDNLVGPELMGIRTYVRPWAFIDPDSYWNRLAFGLTLAGDIRAPLLLAVDDEGNFIVDSDQNIVVDEPEATGVLGFDAELLVFANDWVSVIPYTDVNIHFGHGSGFHLGTLTSFSASDWFGLDTRLEFRALGEGYLPAYFDRLYEVERYQYQPLDSTSLLRPKLLVLSNEPPDARVGGYMEGTFAFTRFVLLTIAYENYQGDDNASFMARLSLPNLGPVHAAAYYVNQNFDNITDMFDLESALLISEARVTVAGPFYVIGQYSRRWATAGDGNYEPVNDWNVGVGLSFDF